MAHLTAAQLIKTTDGPRRKRAQFVRIIQAKKYRTKKTKQGVIRASLQSLKGYGSGKPHGVEIRSMTGNYKISKGPVRVWCTCEDFMYREEYALTKLDASRIRWSNGKPATITNPYNTPYVCKHLAKMLSTIINKRM